MIKALFIVFGCLALGELVVHFTSVAFPSSMIGMLLLTLLLKLGWVRPAWMTSIADFFVGTLPFYFVPAGVGVMLYLDLIQASLRAIVVASVVSTALTLVVTGWVHQYIRMKTRKPGTMSRTAHTPTPNQD